MASSFPALLFSFIIVVAGWIVALAGVAALQSISPVWLRSSTGPTHLHMQTLVIDGQEVTVPLPSWRLSFQWFMVSLQFFVAVLALVFTFTNKLRKTHSGINAHLAFCSVLWALEANRMYQLVRGIEGSDWYAALLNIGYQPVVRYNTLIAGSCILIIGNFFLMFALACGDEATGDKAVEPAAKTVPVPKVRTCAGWHSQCNAQAEPATEMTPTQV